MDDLARWDTEELASAPGALEQVYVLALNINTLPVMKENGKSDYAQFES